MDDMKRAIYLDLLSELEEKDCNTYICTRLLFRLYDLFEIRGEKQHQEVLREFFPEFFAVFDGYKYFPDCRKLVELNHPWFSPSARHARLTLINFLLTHR